MGGHRGTALHSAGPVVSSAARPWLAVYGSGRPADLVPEHPTMLAAYLASVERAPDAVVLRYFDGETTLADPDRALRRAGRCPATRWIHRRRQTGVVPPERPAFVVGLVAAWKAGGCAVPVNPMNRAGELTYLLRDSGARALLCLDGLWADVAHEVVTGGSIEVGLETYRIRAQYVIGADGGRSTVADQAGFQFDGTT